MGPRVEADRNHPQRRAVLGVRRERPDGPPDLLDVAPILGVCYGMQLIAHLEGGAVERAGRREYGRADVEVLETSGVFAGFSARPAGAAPG